MDIDCKTAKLIEILEQKCEIGHTNNSYNFTDTASNQYYMEVCCMVEVPDNVHRTWQSR